MSDDGTSYPSAPTPIFPSAQPRPVSTPSVTGVVSPVPQQPNIINRPGVPPGPPDAVREWRPPWNPPRPRPMDQAGTSWWPVNSQLGYPDGTILPGMPGPMESNKIFQNSSQALAQYGPQSLAPGYLALRLQAAGYAPFLDMFSRGAFSANMLKAQMGRLRMMEEEQLFRAEQQIAMHKQMMEEFIPVFAAAKHGADDDAVRDEITRLAGKWQHNWLLSVMAQKGTQGVWDSLIWEDQHLRAVEEGWASTAKSRKDGGAGGSSYWDEEPGGGGGRTSETPLSTGRPGEPPPAVTAPRLSAGAEPGSITTPAAPTEWDRASAGGLNTPEQSRLMNAIHEGARGDPPKIAESDPRFKAYTAGEAQLRNAIDQVSSGPGSAEDKLAQLKRYDNVIPGVLDAIGHYHVSPTQFGTEGKRRFLTWASQIFGKDFNEDDYKTVQDMRHQGGKINTTQARSNTMVDLAANLVRAVDAYYKKHGAKVIPVHQMINDFAANYWTGADEYRDIFNAARQFAAESSAVSTGTGTTRQFTFKEVLAGISATATPEQILTAIKSDLVAANSLTSNNNATYRQMTREPGYIPGYRPETADKFDAWSRWNPHNNTFPTDAPAGLKVLGTHMKPHDKRDDYVPLLKGEFDSLTQAWAAMDDSDPRKKQLGDLLQRAAP